MSKCLPRLLCPGHTFHIPVMGIGFTLDTPLRISAYGISSVISLVDDVLIEQARRHYCELSGEPFEAVDGDDARARRITAYLDFVDRQVQAHTEALRCSSFDDPKGIRRYFELLPSWHPLRHEYGRMCEMTDAASKQRCAQALRDAVVAGSVDVNIMTKLDRTVDSKGEPLGDGRSDAVAALRGFANSTLRSSVVFSAGFNPRLFGYLPKCPDFLPQGGCEPKKRVILKVSDYRSAQIQGKYLAKRGIWVSEFRIESGLNCGGHAFPTDGLLLGPILESFRNHRETLRAEMFELYKMGLASLGLDAPRTPPTMLVGTQGGVGTAEEHVMLLERYRVDHVGWASPFLLVPEVCQIEDETRQRIAEAGGEQVRLSHGSPIGVRFWLLRTCSSEVARQRRYADGKPGSACPKGLLTRETELSKAPLCLAARGYQRKMFAKVDPDLDPVEKRLQTLRIASPTCICHDLGGSFKMARGIEDAADSCVCPGPNLVHFHKISSLDEMVDHIYGRGDLLADHARPHVLLNETRLYLDYLAEQRGYEGTSVCELRPATFKKFEKNLLDGLQYYRGLSEESDLDLGPNFRAQLETLAGRLSRLMASGSRPGSGETLESVCAAWVIEGGVHQATTTPTTPTTTATTTSRVATLC
ncbi:MAG: hypothetical protein V3V08_00130 [Nannocystaceae bacterium]